MDIHHSFARGLALFLGLYTLAGVLFRTHAGAFDPNLLWIDLRVLPSAIAAIILLLAALILLAFAISSELFARIRLPSLLIMGGFVIMALVNAVTFWRLAASHAIRAQMPVPISTMVAALLIWMARQMYVSPRERRASPIVIALVSLLCATVFPVLQVFGFGKTAYERSADVAVVFGARVYADGQLSDAVADRVATACNLYRRGLIQHLVMSGGPGDGDIYEAEAMRMRAVHLGVPAEAILMDRDGINTAASVRNTLPMIQASGWQRVLVVSEFYHLPRIKMAYAAANVDVFTVPSEPRHWLRAWALSNVAREVPAFWVYYFRNTIARG